MTRSVLFLLKRAKLSTVKYMLSLQMMLASDLQPENAANFIFINEELLSMMNVLRLTQLCKPYSEIVCVSRGTVKVVIFVH